MNPLDIDPYKILGVARDSDLEQVKRAYRRLVRLYHPDICGRNMENIKRFLAIKDAYQILRQKLQATGKVTIFSASSLTEDASKQESVEGTFLFVQIGLKEALYGTSVQVEICEGEDFCQVCKGLGKVADDVLSFCPSCGGKGYRKLNWGDGDLKVICSSCSGSGTKELKRCPQCGGRGITNKKKRIRLQIPPGTKDGTILRLERGLKRAPYKENSTIYVEVEVKAPQGWIIHGRDIISTVDVDCWTKLGGGYIQVETVDGKEEVFITPGLGHEKFIRLKNRGWVDRKGQRGDHLLRLNILPPMGPCPREAMELINRLKALWPCSGKGPLALPGDK